MSVSTVVTRGFGSFAGIEFVVTRGYTVGEAVADLERPLVIDKHLGSGFAARYWKEEREKWAQEALEIQQVEEAKQAAVKRLKRQRNEEQVMINLLLM